MYSVYCLAFSYGIRVLGEREREGGKERSRGDCREGETEREGEINNGNEGEEESGGGDDGRRVEHRVNI